MKTEIVENSAATHAPFSTVVYEQSLPDRHETGPDGQPRLLPRQTLHHVYLRDVATDHYTQLGIAATKAVARHIAAEIQRGHLPAVLLAHGNFRYAVLSDSIFPAPQAALPAASGSPLVPLVYPWSLPDLYETGDDGQPFRLPPRTLYNVWVSDPDTSLRGFLCTTETAATADAIAAGVGNCHLPVALCSTGLLCQAIWTASLSISPLARPALGTC